MTRLRLGPHDLWSLRLWTGEEPRPCQAAKRGVWNEMSLTWCARPA